MLSAGERRGGKDAASLLQISFRALPSLPSALLSLSASAPHHLPLAHALPASCPWNIEPYRVVFGRSSGRGVRRDLDGSRRKSSQLVMPGATEQIGEGELGLSVRQQREYCTVGTKHVMEGWVAVGH